MKAARIAVLGVAVLAGLGAAILASGSKQPEIAVLPPPPVMTDDVLVAAKEFNSGDVIDESGLRWESWPKDHIPDGFIRKSVSPGGADELRGSFACANFAPGDPMRRERLVKDSHCGFLAARLKAGYRAVAINIDTQGSSTAGGFILPNNRVDVIHIYHDEDAARKGIANSYASQTLLTNIRVLAIGPNVQEKNGDHVITGATATLELMPSQARWSFWLSASASSRWSSATWPM
ncbi:Flp pilus assembly protein CpaB [Methylocapsa sp. D3K7]|uniref:Flp pilus assembly protein CpaB n=1 Tax=Methylocapsa sp. D3K7 TaxID=3041435 RepID=UPI00244EC6DF|nr:Flp pilus assembly protein CpaB [Methylocapsa sp. D3K7]WGJ14206.1 Flp pilus assembly protein CpaB [Methylocapsa sp. D3K7]